MHQHLLQFAASFGITDMHPPARIYNTRRALAAAEYARDQGKLNLFRSAAMDAYWRHGADLESEAVLAALGDAAGLDGQLVVRASTEPGYLERVDAQRREATSRGVDAIPTMFIGETEIVGCQPYGRLAAAAERAGVARRRA